jgi:hypothetical protein
VHCGQWSDARARRLIRRNQRDLRTLEDLIKKMSFGGCAAERAQAGPSRGSTKLLERDQPLGGCRSGIDRSRLSICIFAGVMVTVELSWWASECLAYDCQSCMRCPVARRTR